jgi:hypothetical protein
MTGLIGTRIRLLSMHHDPDPLPVGSLGTITEVNDLGTWHQITVKWDDGRTLMLSVPPDQFEII